MKELQLKTKESVEIVDQQQIKKLTRVLFSRKLKKGEKMFSIDIRDNTVRETEIEEEVVVVNLVAHIKKRVKVEEFMAYIPAMNKDNALRKYQNALRVEINRIKSIQK